MEKMTIVLVFDTMILLVKVMMNKMIATVVAAVVTYLITRYEGKRVFFFFN